MLIVIALLGLGLVCFYIFGLSQQRKPDAFQKMVQRRREQRRHRRGESSPDQPLDPNFQFDDPPMDKELDGERS